MGMIPLDEFEKFKNPSSHRDVDWDDPGECAELIYLANHLLRMVEKHRSEIESGE